MTTPSFQDFMASSTGLADIERDAPHPHARKWHIHTGVADFPTLISGVAMDSPDWGYARLKGPSREGNLSLTNFGYPNLMASMLELQGTTQQALNSLSSRVENLTAIVRSMMEFHDAREGRQSDDANDGLAFDGSDPASLLDHACDNGLIDDHVVELAEASLSDADKFTRLAAIRTIALADAGRGKELIAAALKEEGNPTVRNMLEATLRGIGQCS